MAAAASVRVISMPDAASAMEAGVAKRSIPTASLSFRHLAFDAALPGGGTKTILEPCSGHFEAGELVAIMGPSGCGKTTLLDILAMKKSAPHQGEVFVNGRPRNRALFQRIASYVGQEDRMPAHWTVREALEFNTRLKQLPGEDANDMIGGLLDAFGLAEVANVYIGDDRVRGISGGQRRRVSLARGVAAQASVMFCDEPTSGLSATDAEVCVESLRAIAKRMSVLVLVVIHQPRSEVAELFDTLVLLTSSPGRLCYSGPMRNAAAYFEACGLPIPERANATDIMLDHATPGAKRDESVKLVAAYDARLRQGVAAAVEVAVKTPGPTVQEMLQAAHGGPGRVRLGKYAVPFCTQFGVLLRRQLQVTFRNPAAVGLQIGMPLGMGVVLGALFQGIGHHDFGIAHLQFIFILLTMLSLQTLPLMPLLIDQRMYMKYETSEKLYAETACMLTTLCVTVPLSLIGAALQTAIIFLFSQMAADLFWPIMFWTLLLFFFFDAVFQCVAAVAPDAHQALTMALPFLVVFMLFNGVIVTRATAPFFLRWVFEICPNFYAMQALAVRMAKDAGPMGQMIVDGLGYEDGQQTTGIAVILTLTVVTRAFTCLAMKFLNNLKR
mmetsp:Transcript_70466/g.197645  ORF Transcript_70466/g.197645 Transcript_70466/m.197645 type:complete len:611 (-) Transcript_70466:216-2048(-)